MVMKFAALPKQELKSLLESKSMWLEINRLDNYNAIAEALEASAVPEDAELAKQQLIKLRGELSETLHMFEDLEL